jgi:hypothetical protein
MLNTKTFPHKNLWTLIFSTIGIMLLSLSSAYAQVPEKGLKQAPVSKVIADSVLKNGNKISGGWYEYPADGSWRRVAFTLDDLVGRVVISDGKPGSELPDITRFSASGRPGYKGRDASYQEQRNFTDNRPNTGDKSNRTSLIPDSVANRIHELGGDIKLMQQLLDIKRISDIGSAFDAAYKPGADDGLTNGFPGTGAKGRDGKWSDPRAGVGRDGSATDSFEITEDTRDRDGYGSVTTVETHNDGSTTTETRGRNRDGSTHYSKTEANANGDITGGNSRDRSASGERTSIVYTRNTSTGEITFWNARAPRNGQNTSRVGRARPATTPPETGGSRGGFDEAWLARSIPWLMDAYYADWKRESDQVKSGGRISQPGRAEQSTMILNESPRVGASAVINCGDSNTNPCARTVNTKVDTGAIFRKISQPGRGTPTGPIDGKEQPKPIPVPEPKP